MCPSGQVIHREKDFIKKNSRREKVTKFQEKFVIFPR